MKPAVSVVLPVRNGGRFLSGAMDSLLTQSLRDIEVIAIDNGSTDGSHEVLGKYASEDPRVTVLTHPTPGIVGALNAGIARSQAPLIARMDADDICEPMRLEAQLQAMDASPELAVLGTWATTIDKASVPTGLMRPPTEHAEIHSTLLEGNCLIHPSVMMKRTVVETLGGYRTAYEGTEDYDLWLRVSDRHRMGNLASALLRYRIHEGQATYTALERRLVSEVAALAGTIRRRAGLDDLGSPPQGFSTETLLGLGLTRRDISAGIARRAVSAARGALGTNNLEAARSALQIAARQPRPGLRTWVSLMKARSMLWLAGQH